VHLRLLSKEYKKKKKIIDVWNLIYNTTSVWTSDKSEIVSQVIFGEHFEILEQVKQWSRIKLQYDSYEGWVDSKQYQILSEANFIQLSNDAIILSADLIEYITGDGNILLPVPLGSSLSFKPQRYQSQ
jgi:hypothetical protein